MRARKLGVFAIATGLALSVAACASDRNQEVKSVEGSNVGFEQPQTPINQTAIDDTQAREQAAAAALAPQKPTVNDDRDRAELQPPKQDDDQTDAKPDGAKEIAAVPDNNKAAIANANANANAQNANANAQNMQQERTAIETDAKTRFDKALARANALKNQSAKIPAARKTKWMSDWNAYESKKIEVQNRITNLAHSPNDQWKDTKEQIEKALEDLDAVVGRLDF